MLFRLIIGVPLAAIVTLSLFMLMRELITNRESLLPDEVASISIDITRSQREEESANNRELNRPDQQDQPPPPPPMDTRTERPDLGGLSVGLPEIDLNLGSGVGPIDGEIQPLVRVPPEYPMRAAERGVEGTVCVTFTVTAEGTVINPVVRDSTSSMFNRASIRAIGRFRYQPKIENGEPVPRPGVNFCFYYELDNESRR